MDVISKRRRVDYAQFGNRESHTRIHTEWLGVQNGGAHHLRYHRDVRQIINASRPNLRESATYVRKSPSRTYFTRPFTLDQETPRRAEPTSRNTAIRQSVFCKELNLMPQSGVQLCSWNVRRGAVHGIWGTTCGAEL